MISKDKVLKLVNERIEELNNGLFVVDISISSTNSIQVELDKHQGHVSVNDCMSVSRNVEHNLDRETEDFELHVTSAGLDRPLRIQDQFVKNYGKEVVVKMNDGRKVQAVLLSSNEKELVVEQSRMEKPEGSKKKIKIVEQIVLPKTEIKETKIVITFK